jgi:decaprenylphospho-beta-D-ribofuranose 2-oxidase
VANPTPTSTLELSGWGNLPQARCRVTRPDTHSRLSPIVTGGPVPSLIPRGLGRSYGDPALDDRGLVVDLTRLDAMLDFDPGTGILGCQAGVSLGDILDTFVPRGWTLPVMPGTRFVTVGGAIAADVHGKNHHQVGSFAACLVDLDLMLASGETMHCSREAESDAFWATVGGMGLTGIVTEARIRLEPVETAYCRVSSLRTRDLDETLERFESTANASPYSVAWVDCLARGRSLGRSVLMFGGMASHDELPAKARNEPLQAATGLNLAVPLPMPSFALNPLTVKAFNTAYYASHRDGTRIVDARSFFHPLDGIADWNRVYGRRGFVQYQALLPPSTSRRGLIELLGAISEARAASFLSVLKTTGPASGGMLSYLEPGHTLALDLPNTGEPLRRLAHRLDEILLRHGGRLYLAKDALTTAEAFAAMYPTLPAFRAVKARLDPNRRFVSIQARRLGIVEDP